ncbi:hypothetical protein F5887DRAFT_1228217, partial [Amanita rubescens]
PRDLVIVHDVTGSQGPYIAKTTKRCEEICLFLRRCGKLQPGVGLRVALIAFRDHPPMDNTFVTEDFGGFTYELEDVQRNLRKLTAAGGGDIPEAVTAALARAIHLNWRPDATKIVILITDAPPHGIGDPNDKIPGGDPDGYDPLILARQMAKENIILSMIACEPTLSGHAYANEFYEALARITTGVMFPLTDTNLLASFIIASTLETIDLNNLSRRYERFILDRKHAGKKLEEIAKEVFEELKRTGTMAVGIETDNPYTPARGKDIQFWQDAKDLAFARASLGNLTRYDPEGRFTEEYKKRRAAHPACAEVEITFRNNGSDRIEFMYYEDKPITGVILPEEVQPRLFQIDVPYNIHLSSATKENVVGRTFSKRDDMELAIYLL